MTLSLSNVPTEGIAHGTLYICKGEGTFEELCAVTDIPEFTSEPEEELTTDTIAMNFCRDAEFSFEIRRGTRSWKNIQRVSYGWKAKGPVRKRTRSKAFEMTPFWEVRVV